MDALKPRLNRGCRLRDDLPAVLIPEGMLKLSSGGLRVLRLCDGERAVSAIITELQASHPGTASETIDRETRGFLRQLIDRGVLAT